MNQWIMIPRTDRARVRLKRFLDRNLEIRYHKLVDGAFYFPDSEEPKLIEYIKKQFKNFQHESKAKVGSDIHHDMWIFEVEYIKNEAQFEKMLAED